MSTHDFNGLVAAKAAALKAWRAASTATNNAQAAFRAAEIASGFVRGRPARPPRPALPGASARPPRPALPGAPAPATPPPATPDWAALGTTLSEAIAVEAPLKAIYLAAKAAQDAAEKDAGAQ